jgi:hypothetical protein
MKRLIIMIIKVFTTSLPSFQWMKENPIPYISNDKFSPISFTIGLVVYQDTLMWTKRTRMSLECGDTPTWVWKSNFHNLLRNPLNWPISVLQKFIPHRVKVWRDCAHNISSFPLTQIPIRGWLAFVRCTLLRGRVRCDGCGTILPMTDCVHHCSRSALLHDTSTVPFPSVTYCLQTLNFFLENAKFFFWPVGRFVTVMQVWESHGVLGQGDIRFLFC